MGIDTEHETFSYTFDGVRIYWSCRYCHKEIEYGGNTLPPVRRVGLCSAQCLMAWKLDGN